MEVYNRLLRILGSTAFLLNQRDNLLNLSEIRSFHDGPTVCCYPYEFRFYPDE
jgi:hypothetical protein